MLTNRRIETYRRDGYLVIPRLIESDQLAEWRVVTDRIVAKARGGVTALRRRRHHGNDDEEHDPAVRFTDTSSATLGRKVLSLLALAAVVAFTGPAFAAEPLKIGSRYGTVDFAIGDSKVFRTTGTFKDWNGTLKVDDANVRNSSVDVVVNTGSVQMLDQQQTAMLKDGDFFDVERYPRMTFRSTRVERTGENSLKVDGDVTLRGVTRPMTLDVTVSDRKPNAPPGARYARFRGVGTIKRSEFGMTKYADVVGDTVEISIATDARR